MRSGNNFFYIIGFNDIKTYALHTIEILNYLKRILISITINYE